MKIVIFLLALLAIACTLKVDEDHDFYGRRTVIVRRPAVYGRSVFVRRHEGEDDHDVFFTRPLLGGSTYVRPIGTTFVRPIGTTSIIRPTYVRPLTTTTFVRPTY